MGRDHAGRLFCLLVTALALASTPSRGGSIEDVEFAESVRAGDTQLSLVGLALLRYRILFKGYVAALYLPAGVQPSDALGDVPKRLELEYFWSIRGEDFGPAGDEILARNVSKEALEALRPRLDRINALYQDVTPGDRYALTYQPGRGTELAKNGEPLGVIPGADFAAGYFAIWLGDDPIDASFRSQLFEGTD